jgi:hypothetical protein
VPKRSGTLVATNLVFAHGLKVPRIEDRTAQAQGFQVHDVRPNQPVFVFPSLTMPSSGGFSLDASRGIDLNFTVDGLTLAAIGAFTPFLAATNAQGTAVYPWPNWATFLGRDLWYAAASWDGAARRWSGFSDPVKQLR